MRMRRFVKYRVYPRGFKELKMDVHRLKFLDLKPHTVLCIAFNQLGDSPKVAVSRSDGSIEIWNVVSEEDREIAHHVTIPGRKDVTVEKLVWRQHRLFSAGLSGTLNEWDPISLGCVGSADAMGSPIWCMDTDPIHERLAVGTDDGKVCLYDVSDSSLLYTKTLSNQNCRILSLSWHSKGSNLALGCSDSTVRVVCVDNGRCTMRITMDKAGNNDTLVWDVLYLSDFTLVTGSSTGKVQFWNGQYGTLRHSYQSHLADVLALVVDGNEGVIYASGVDAKVVEFKRIKDDVAKWVQCGGVRVHSHDIKSLAITAGGNTDNGCVVSGGVDTTLVVYGINGFNCAPTTTYSPFSSWTNRFKYALSSNTLVYQGADSLRFWRITPKNSQVVFNSSGGSNSCSPDKDALNSYSRLSPTPSDSNVSLPSLNSSVESDLLISSGLPVNFLEINTSTAEHILSSAISYDGSLVVLSCNTKTWVYSIGGGRVTCLSSCDLSACSVAIKQDNSEILLGLSTGGLSKLCLPVSVKKQCNIVFEHVMNRKRKLSFMFTDIKYSPCGEYLLLLNRKFRMSIYNSSSLSCLFKIPRLDDYRIPHALFDPSRPLIHIYTSSNRELYEFNFKQESLESIGSLTVANKRGNGLSSLSCRAANGFCVLSSSGSFITYNNTGLMVLKNNSDLSLKCGLVGQKRTRDCDDEGTPLSYKSIRHSSEVLFVTPLLCGELLMVEKSWEDVLKNLPPVLKRKQYAT